MLSNFCHENKAKCCRFSSWKFGNNSKRASKALIKGTPLSKIKPQSPIILKPQKLMPIACFQLPMFENYDFTKTKNCLRTGVVGCLTPSPHGTKLPNSRIKIFLPSILD